MALNDPIDIEFSLLSDTDGFFEEPIDDIEEKMFDRGQFTRPDWASEDHPWGEQSTDTEE